MLEGSWSSKRSSASGYAVDGMVEGREPGRWCHALRSGRADFMCGVLRTVLLICYLYKLHQPT